LPYSIFIDMVSTVLWVHLTTYNSFDKLTFFWSLLYHTLLIYILFSSNAFHKMERSYRFSPFIKYSLYVMIRSPTPQELFNSSNIKLNKVVFRFVNNVHLLISCDFEAQY